MLANFTYTVMTLMYVLIRRKSFGNITSSFKGTLINIALKCDEKRYCFSDEAPKNLHGLFL